MVPVPGPVAAHAPSDVVAAVVAAATEAAAVFVVAADAGVPAGDAAPAAAAAALAAVAPGGRHLVLTCLHAPVWPFLTERRDTKLDGLIQNCVSRSAFALVCEAERGQCMKKRTRFDI